MKLELTPQKFITVESDGTDPIFVGLEAINSFVLYEGTTLEDVLEIIDERAEYHNIDEQEILDEIGYEGSIDELLNDPLSLISRLYIETLLYKINEKTLSNYEDALNGEERLYAMISFEGEGNDKEAINRISNIEAKDLTDGELSNIQTQKQWESNVDLFVILTLSTYY